MHEQSKEEEFPASHRQADVQLPPGSKALVW